MKVVHVHRVRGVGGSERHLLTLLPALRARGVDARFLGLDDGDPDPFYAQLDALGVPYDRLRGAARPRPAASRRGWPGSCGGSGPTSCTRISSTPTSTARLASIAAGSTLVSTKHNDDPFRARLVPPRRAAVRAARSADHLHHRRARALQRPRGRPAGGEARRRPLRARRAARSLGAARGLGSPGGRAAAPRDLAARAAEGARRRDRGAGADPGSGLAGDAPDPRRRQPRGGARRRSPRRAASRTRRSSPAARATSPHWLERADVFVHPARWEGFGLVLLEAMLARLPIVASEVSSIPEIVVDGETGLPRARGRRRAARVAPSPPCSRMPSRRAAFGDAAPRARPLAVLGRADGRRGRSAVYAEALAG